MTRQEWLLKLFPGAGYFVEAGAHDGVGDSQTYHLELRGWTGICVEPSSAYAGLVQSRRCRTDHRCLWSADGQEVEFLEVRGDGVELSGIRPCFGDRWDRPAMPHRVFRKRTVTLATLLREHGAPALPGVIEFLSLDTEGSELAILAAHDFAAYRFAAIAVEHNRVAERRCALARLLGERGYEEVEIDPKSNDSTFLHRSVAR